MLRMKSKRIHRLLELKEEVCSIRKYELFDEIELIHKNIVTSVPLKMYPQERDS